jgi:hypothetical protein
MAEINEASVIENRVSKLSSFNLLVIKSIKTELITTAQVTAIIYINIQHLLYFVLAVS